MSEASPAVANERQASESSDRGDRGDRRGQGDRLTEHGRVGRGGQARRGRGLQRVPTVLQTRQESWSYPDAFAGALFLITGVVFPLAVLPAFLQVLGLVNPVTWWIEGVRESVLPDGPSGIGGPGSVWTAVTGTGSPDGATIVLALFVTGALATLAAIAIFRRSEHRARDLGLLDRTTGS